MTDEPPDPRADHLDAILRKARAGMLRGLTLEPQLAAGEERQQARRMVLKAVRELVDDLSDWTGQYTAAGPLVTAEQRDELQRLFDADEADEEPADDIDEEPDDDS
jgi:hypothetical protein